MSIVVPVIGCMRSGTSVTAAICHKLGCPMSDGEKWVPMPDPTWGKDHFYADSEIAGWLEACLMNGSAAPSFGMKVVNPKALDGLADAFAIRAAKYPLWGFKHYWVPLLWPSIEPLLLAAGCTIRPIFTARSLDLAAASYAAVKEQAITTKATKDLLQPWMDAMTAIQAAYPGALVVDFESLANDPATGVPAIASYLALASKQQAVDWVDPSLKHY